VGSCVAENKKASMKVGARMRKRKSRVSLRHQRRLVMAKKKKWSRKVTETSDAMTLDKGVFKKSPHAIALSLKRSAERSRRRKTTSFRSAMSMLTFYVNRGGKNLSAAQKKKLGKAKDELRELYQR
jgi:hypothetical protein